MGYLVDQSFSGAGYDKSSTPNMLVGNGDWANNFTKVGGEELVLNSDSNKYLDMQAFYFGASIDGVQHYSELFPSTETGTVTQPGALFATNLPGIQMPASQFRQWSGLMTRINADISNDFECTTNGAYAYN